ncbi:hypothetical protein GCM10027451_13970 [Geodermatophilus aquaeductus]|uniref:Uncharacterized protein n=1 Tax=Geodermatophilus aquaeductus TaxID=1564161 RepID=A0A521BF91_9ACTN|nr:hypothetical protein [Geodermatophilus aquaeductus]SMO45380.1 hypothetical protein SAMN06273567_101692 [Geodermatophilus aquaeductus]
MARRAAARVAAEVVSVDAGLVAEWSGSRDGVLVSLGAADPPLVVTRQLLQVAAFLAALGGLSFAVEVIADAGTRETLVRDLVVRADVAPEGAQGPAGSGPHAGSRGRVARRRTG